MIRRGSLRSKLILLSVGVLTLYYTLISLFSILFMEPYYLHKVERTLVDAYETLNEMEDLDLGAIAELEASNLSIVVADRDTLEVYYNSQIPAPSMPDFISQFLPHIRNDAMASDMGYNINTDDLYQQTSAGTRMPGGRRVMLGGVTDRYVLDISTPYASIAQATGISVQFSLIVGLVVMVLAVLAFSRISTAMIHPITQITNIAHQIAHLDFSQKCDVDMDGEIGMMAESVNTMSDFMQTYTTELQKANEQLKADIQQKKEQEEARKNLVANLSHDLKTPIGLISGYADGLRQGMAKTEAEVREYCDVICDESDRMMTMILKMMELFRLESGTVELELEEFDLSDLLRYEEEIFSMELERAGIHYTGDYGDALYVFTDYFAAEQILTNYIQNALSHINSGSDMRLCVKEQADCYRVSVFNSSAPIPEEELPRLWDSFYRLDKSRGRSQRESGLGLSIVKRNMELLGCGYGVRNVDGGVVFWAEFPKSPPTETKHPS